MSRMRHLIEEFEQKKKEKEEELRYMETDRDFRLFTRTAQGEIDITEQRKTEVRAEIQEYRRFIEDLQAT